MENGTATSLWQSDAYSHAEKSRGSLGQFIERSTSAPPASMKMDSTGDALVGNDLLDFVTKGYGELSVSTKSETPSSTHSTSLQRATNIGGFGAVFGGGILDDEDGRATAPSTYLHGDFVRNNNKSSSISAAGAAVTRPLSASGGDVVYSDFLSNNEFGGFRSRSAAPNFQDSNNNSSLGPPPGLGSGGYSGSSGSSPPSDRFSNLGIRRPASTGVPSLGAVRPAPKKLMDFIQEDDDQIHQQRSATNASPSVVASAASPYLQSKSYGMNNQSSLQMQLQMEQTPESLNHTYQQQQQQPQQLQQQQFHQNFNASGNFDPQQQQQLLQQQQQLVMNANGTTYRQGSPDDAMQGNIYVQQHNQQQTMLHNGQQIPQQQQQIFYGNQTQGLQAQGLQSQGLQTQGLQPQGLQAQVLPNGQTVYVNTGPAQQQYGYTTVQYQSPHHPQQIIHQQIPGGQGEQYVSVVPLQGGGQQVAYWHPNGMPQQQTLGQTMVGPGGTQIALNRLGNGQIDPNTMVQFGGGAGRGRDKAGGGRGRRTTTPRTVRTGETKSSASPLLEEFRASKSRDWTMRRIEGHIVDFCQDQNGSRFIQQRLEMGDINEQQIVMKEVLPAIRRLRNDVFGNYVVQKLLDFGNDKMKAEIRDTLEGEMLQLSLQMYGCRVVQKALEALDEDDLPRLLREFHHNVLSCIHDQNGNHVVQKCIEVMNSRAKKAGEAGDTHRAQFLSEQIDFVVDDVLNNTTTLSCHPYGCRVLQRILEHCDDRKKSAILDEIKKCHKTLLDDQYGNYVIQHVLQYGREEDRDSILDIIVESGLLGLSRQKFASNVVEKLLKYGNAPQRRRVVGEMLKPANDPTMNVDQNTAVVLLMVRDAYANYVVQTTLDVAPESEEKRLLLEELNSHVDELRNYTFAKHIVAKLISLNEENNK